METFYYDRGVLVKQINKDNHEFIWKTKTDSVGNYLLETDITFTKNELSKNYNLSVIEEKALTFFVVTYTYKVFLNGKFAAFIPVETIDNISVVFDILNKNYYRIDGKYQEKVGIATLTLLAKNKEAIFVKLKQYNKLHNLYRKYHMLYAGINRNPNGYFVPHSKVNIHAVGDTNFILYDRFFDKNYYASVETGSSVYILNEALADMFYIVEKPDGQLLFYFIHNGVEIETPRLKIEHTNGEQDLNVFIDYKLTYFIKNYKALEKEKVYYPTVI